MAIHDVKLTGVQNKSVVVILDLMAINDIRPNISLETLYRFSWELNSKLDIKARSN